MTTVVTSSGEWKGSLEGYNRSVVELKTAGAMILFPWHVVLRVVVEEEDEDERKS